MKRIGRLKAIVKKRIRPILLALTLLVTMGISGRIPEVKAEPNDNGVTFTKTAVREKDGTRITFNIEGRLQEADPKTADIVLLIDRSGSMAYDKDGNAPTIWNGWQYVKNPAYDSSDTRLTRVQASAKALIESILNDKDINKNGNIRIAVASFAENAATNQTFISNISTLESAVNGITADGGTNTEAGIKKAGELLDTSKADKKYVVMFTDGLPTFYLANGTKVQGPGYASPDPCFGYAQEEYNRVIGGITNLGGIGEDGYYDEHNRWVNASYEDKTVANTPGRHSDAKFYSIGFTSKDSAETAMMENFLKTTQNVIDQDKFAAKYCTGDVSAISGIFEDITEEIKQSISSIVDNATIKDTVTSDFVIPSEVWKTVEVNGAKITDNESIVKATSDQNIVLDLSKVPQTADSNGVVRISVSFLVNDKDAYFSGNGIATNDGDAVLTYTDPKDKSEKTLSVSSPAVDIAPVEGSISIEKAVGSLDGIAKSDKTTNDFPIYIERKIETGSDGKIVEGTNNRKERYGFQISGGSTASMNFYMRGNITDVSRINNAKDTGKNYLTAGTYTVKEIVPMDYVNTKIEYSYDNSAWNNLTDDGFKIDKTHKNVYLKVTNKINNASYWRDRSDAANEFQLVK